MYDDLFRLRLPHGYTIVGFVDDIGVVGFAKEGIKLEDIMNIVIDSIANWLENCGLKLVLEKMKAVMLIRRWAFKYPQMVVNDHEIEIKKLIRYLGIELDAKLKFGAHITKVTSKATT